MESDPSVVKEARNICKNLSNSVDKGVSVEIGVRGEEVNIALQRYEKGMAGTWAAESISNDDRGKIILAEDGRKMLWIGRTEKARCYENREMESKVDLPSDRTPTLWKSEISDVSKKFVEQGRQRNSQTANILKEMINIGKELLYTIENRTENAQQQLWCAQKKHERIVKCENKRQYNQTTELRIERITMSDKWQEVKGKKKKATQKGRTWSEVVRGVTGEEDVRELDARISPAVAEENQVESGPEQANAFCRISG